MSETMNVEYSLNVADLHCDICIYHSRIRDLV